MPAPTGKYSPANRPGLPNPWLVLRKLPDRFRFSADFASHEEADAYQKENPILQWDFDACPTESARRNRSPSAIGPRDPPSLTAATSGRSPRSLAVARFLHALWENGMSNRASRSGGQLEESQQVIGDDRPEDDAGDLWDCSDEESVETAETSEVRVDGFSCRCPELVNLPAS